MRQTPNNFALVAHNLFPVLLAIQKGKKHLINVQTL